ncbi:c-type cytochrome [Anaeromyxobacter oryzae]|nr:c-type cytochrome [Anaeromyxobacter oryzae]
MKKSSAALLLAILSCSSGPRLPSGPPRGDTVVEVSGAVKGGPFRLGKADLDALPRGKVEGTDPVTGRAATWEGPQLTQLAYGRVELTKGADTAVVRTADRRAVPIPFSQIRTFRPVLADRADGVPLPDRVVAWPTGAQRGLLTDPRARLWWARGVVAIEIVNSFTTYGRALAVPDGAPEGARPGADLFGALCIACHRLRKAGGEAGPDLTRIADRIAPDAFFAMLAKHPGWTDATGEARADGGARQLWAFLRSVAAVEAGAAEPPEQPPEKERGGDRHGYPAR